MAALGLAAAALLWGGTAAGVGTAAEIPATALDGGSTLSGVAEAGAAASEPGGDSGVAPGGGGVAADPGEGRGERPGASGTASAAEGPVAAVRGDAGSPPAPAVEVAQLIAVEVGARVAPMRRAFCKLVGDGRFSLTSDGQLALDAKGVGARAELLLGDCKRPQSATLVGVARRVPAELRSRPEIEIEPDQGTVTVRAARLAGRAVWWRAGPQAPFVEATLGPLALSDGREIGHFPVTQAALHAVLDDPTSPPGRALEALVLPEGAAAPGEGRTLTLWDPRGVEVSLSTLRGTVARVVLDRPPVQPAPLEAWRDTTQLPVTWPGLVQQVACPSRGCQLTDDRGLVLVTPPTDGDTLRLQVTLREGAVLRGPKGLTGSAEVLLALARCKLSPLLPAVLAGVADHHVPLALEGSCPGELTDLLVETSPVTVASAAPVPAPDGRPRLDVTIAQTPRGPAVLRLQLRAGPRRTLVGSVTLPLSDAALSTRTTLYDSDVGEVDVVPINRPVEARVLTQDFRVSAALAVEALPGFYQVLSDPGGAGRVQHIQGVAQSGGSIPLLVGYRPPEAQLPADGPPLAYFQALPGYQVREVSVPVTLAAARPRPGLPPLFEIHCHDGAGRDLLIGQGQVVNVTHDASHTCRLLIDHGALLPTDGPQRVRISIGMSHPDSTPAPGSSSKVVTVRPRKGLETIWLEPSAPIREFDHMRITLAHDDAANFYLGSADAPTGAGVTAESVEIVFGDSLFRLYGSAAIPTGLYRINGPLAGAINFSAGALMRLAWLSRRGNEFPIDAEFGIFGTGISQQANLSFVFGPGLTVPILNPGQAAQASVGIHAWLEYSPTLLNPSSPANPTGATNFADRLAVIFGPSVSIGDFGANF